MEIVLKDNFNLNPLDPHLRKKKNQQLKFNSMS